MDLTSLAMLIAIVGIASYIHTLTGFAFALVFMSAIALTGAIGIEEGALIATLLALLNASLLLPRERHFVSTAIFKQIVPLALVGTIAGALLLPLLVDTSVTWLMLLLGLVVVVSSVRLLRVPRDPDAQPGPLVFPLSGLAGGFLGGLFAVPGPPIVYALQRYVGQPRQNRATMLAVFAAIALIRLASTRFSVLPVQTLLASTLFLIPTTIIATEIARRWPPPLSQKAMKIFTVVLLLLTGVGLIVRAIAKGY